MPQRHPFLTGIVVTACLTTFGLAVITHAKDDDRPSAQQIAFAKDVSDLMVNELVAALLTEFNETTPANVEHGKQAISLIFNDLNRDIRLVGAFDPLLGGDNNRPADKFERTAIKRALTGAAYVDVQKVNDRWLYRRTVPLSNRLHTACVQCHTNFTPQFFSSTGNDGQWVGALVVGVPIKTDDDDR